MSYSAVFTSGAPGYAFSKSPKQDDCFSRWYCFLNDPRTSSLLSHWWNSAQRNTTTSSRVSDASTTGWAWTAWASSGSDVSPSEGDSHIIRVETMGLHHIKSPIGCGAISGRADSCTLSAYINKQGKTLSVEAAESSRYQASGRLRILRAAHISASRDWRFVWGLTLSEGVEAEPKHSAPNLDSSVEGGHESGALRQITHHPLCTKDGVAALFYPSPHQTRETDIVSRSCGHDDDSGDNNTYTFRFQWCHSIQHYCPTTANTFGFFKNALFSKSNCRDQPRTLLHEVRLCIGKVTSSTTGGQQKQDYEEAAQMAAI